MQELRIKMLSKIAKELGLEFSDKSIVIMLSLLENKMSPENLAKMLEEIDMEYENVCNKEDHRL